MLSNQIKQVLITGTSGFVGQNLHHYLVEKYFLVIPFSRKNGLEYNSINYNLINNYNIDTIIHLAGKAHDLKDFSNINEYNKANIDLTKNIFDAFLKSSAKTFIFLSSVKAVKDDLDFILTEDVTPTPKTVYGKSKLDAEKYIQSYTNLNDKRIFIIRPCMIHGPGNKGNLNLLYEFVSKKIPWPLGAFQNKRSFCSVENLCFVIYEIIINKNIQSGIYNIADDQPLSTNQIIQLIAQKRKVKPIILNFNKRLILIVAKFGDLFNLPLNTERLHKLTENYIVCNDKIKKAIGKELPITSYEGMIKTLNSFI